MDQIKDPRRGLSLRKSLMFYIAAFAALAIVLSDLTAMVCNDIAQGIRSSYPPPGERYYLTNEEGEQLGEGVYIGKEPVLLSAEDERALALLELFPLVATPSYSGLCIIAGALLFYRNKLKTPLSQLRMASEKMAQNDLDFSLTPDSGDELGQLILSFERMRATLVDNFSSMWRQVEERKQLGAAFAHDLRTPLTVLKGYAELLQTAADPQTRGTAATMAKHIARMERYIDSMSSLRRLEDTQPEYRATDLPPLFAALEESAGMVCSNAGKTLRMENRVTIPRLALDGEFISEVCGNLLANAARYAEAVVTLSLSVREGGLLVTVADDGPGFGETALRQGMAPYFTGESDRSQHFGLGLYICKLLCEHHNGSLKLENTPQGAKVSAFFGPPHP